MRYYFLLILIIISSSCKAQPEQNQDPDKTIKVGAENLTEYLPLLKDKKVALLANHSSLVGNTHLVDTLLSNQIGIVKVFAPEHGFRGDRPDGAKIDNTKDPKTGIPIVSMYGKNKSLPVELLEGVDVLIFDIQDVGVRFFTYISAMAYAMKSCAASGTKFIVLDRPNPNGMLVDGPMLDSAFSSYVGMLPIPAVHGLTVGELAKMINGEGWTGDNKCELTVIPVKNYDHGMPYNLPVKPSPNLPSDKAITLYPSLALFEGTVISVGRGTYQPFLQYGHPSFTDLNYSFTPVSIPNMSAKPPLENQKCYGYSFEDIDVKHGFTLKYLLDAYNKFEDKESFFLKTNYFNLLMGNDKTMQQIKSGMDEAAIEATWKPGLELYKEMRKKYLLYKDFE
ncbi:exo-beta-N-acetylmuramidase NamZ family protein [Fulvivirga lutimaris]|uniref:exo-beta-N-acetylmuramidase NamZ family protein n=1 Tax=Fulvivirga lutimaris TaxID=1819566 RepID=UPI0012BB831E|nr:DUF1343 domain-containing protein [Fulvivirga lutimaris]MTI38493.1 DUF1343 domain-containing protein [Fulvivirga lutimaris]